MSYAENGQKRAALCIMNADGGACEGHLPRPRRLAQWPAGLEAEMSVRLCITAYVRTFDAARLVAAEVVEAFAVGADVLDVDLIRRDVDVVEAEVMVADVIRGRSA